MRLLELQFGRVLHRHYAFGRGDEAGEEVQKGGLAGAGAAGHDDVLAQNHAGAHELGGVVGPGAEAYEVFCGEGPFREFPDRDGGAGERKGRDYGIDAGAVGEAGVDVGLRFVDAPAEGGDYALNHGHDAGVVGELQVGELEAAVAFHVDAAGAVDHDFRDSLVGQEVLERAETKSLVEDFAFEAGGVYALGEAPVLLHLRDDLVDLLAGLGLKSFAVDALGGEALEVEAGE